MTLRGRLAVAFFVVVLGPVALGGYLLWTLLQQTPAAPTQPPPALVSVQNALAARCQHLAAVARSLAVSSAGHAYAVDPPGAAGPWLTCAAGTGADDGLFLAPVVAPPDGTRYAGLAARAEIRSGGVVTGYAYAVEALDGDLLAALSAAAGGPVRLLDVGSPDAAAGLALPLALPPPSAAPAVVRADAAGWWLAGVTALAVVVASALSWWLAALATRPLRLLLRAVERVVAGDLTVRSQLAGRDETGRLGTGLDQLIAGMQETRQLSVTDALTGLGNVRQLSEALRREAERANRFGRALGVLVLDLDHFKAVNDRYGHRAGDAVLVEVSRRLRRAIREVDLAFRQGGEEFVILLPETDVAGSLTAARRIGEAMREGLFLVPDRRERAVEIAISVTVSIGVAVFPRHAVTGAAVLDLADEALYAAKHAGRDTFVLAGAAAGQGDLTGRTVKQAPAPGRPAVTPSVCLADAGGASGGTTSPRTSPAG